jgi:DNA-binding SARP family transcriptional activator
VQPTLHLLESPRVLFHGQRNDLTSHKPILLLLYLAVKQDWVTRDELLVVFYPEDDETSARHNLRVLINRAKSVAWAKGLETEPNRLRWLVSSDAVMLREALAKKDWAAVLRLHQQPLLSGLNLEGAPGFEAWLEVERASLLNGWRKAALEQVRVLSDAGNHQDAAAILQNVLKEDTLAEDILALYLKQAYLSGRRGDALQTFERFKETLKDELGLEPLESTTRLAGMIQRSATLTPGRAQPHSETNAIPLTVRRPPRLIGREKEQQQLRYSKTPVVLVSGEPGVGKTRLLQDTLPDALWLRCLEGLAVPYYPLLELIRAHTSRLPDLGFYREDLARLLPELSHHDTPLALEPALAKTRLLEALAFVLESFQQPLVLDDLQWCDASTLEVFVFLATRQRLKLYATFRQGEEAASLRSTLGTLRRQNLLTDISLEPFKQQDIQHLLADLVGIPEGPKLFSSWLFARSGGNALFALETLKTLFEQGILQERDGNWHSDLDEVTQDYSELEVPPKIAELIARRLEHLSSEARRVVQAASVVREGFSAQLLAQLVGLSELATLEALEQAESSGLVKGEGFSHDLFRQSIYTTLPQSRRVLQHGMLAELLQNEPLLSASHWRKAGKLERAWELELEMAETQLQRGLLGSGLDLLETILQETPKEHPVRLETLVIAGTYLHLLDTRRTDTYLEEVLNAPKLTPMLKFRALLAGVNNAVYQGNMSKAQHFIRQAEMHTNARQELSLRLELEHSRLEVMLRSGDFAGAEARLGEVYALDEKNVDTQSYEAQLRFYQARFVEAAALFEKMRQQDPDCIRRLTLENDLGATYWMLGQLNDAEKELNKSLETWRGSPHVEALSHMHLAFVQMTRGRTREAVEFAEKAITYSRAFGSLTFEADALHHLGVVYFQSGQLTKARECMENALGQMQKVGDVYRHARMLSTMLGVYAMSGDSNAAQRIVPDIEALLKVTPNPLVAGFTAQAKGLLALHHNDLATARELFIAAECFGREHEFREFLCLALLTRAKVEQQPGHLLQEALELAQQYGFRLQEYHIRVQLGEEGADEVLEFLRSNAPEGWF